MIPALVAAEVRETLLDYLRTTWALSDRELERALFSFLESDRRDGGTGIFQGPYLRLRLPFEPAPPDARIPLDLRVPYTPYRHQLAAWQRLSSKDGREPQPTLVVTGTGSGKTEAFLLPILDHCLRARERGDQGIKAIVLYPMNALAADQARRIAEMVYGDDDAHPMRGKLRVGMYVGGKGQHRVMGPDHVIDDRDQLRDQPPDLLLTNYKMLDFLLLRPSDRRLWADNGPDTLRYLVLDELHTYDGAQGTDVACLVRRLAARLGGARFCPVGTSATVTSEDGSSQARLLEFASQVFGRRFDADAVVGETRRDATGFFGLFGPAAAAALPEDVTALRAGEDDDIESYVGRVAEAFFPDDPRLVVDGEVDRVRLGDRVARHRVARALIELATQRIFTLEELDAALAEHVPAWGARARADRRVLLEGLLAMISWAEREAGGATHPLLSVQVQVWVREVRRVVRAVDERPRFLWRDEHPRPPTGELWLPMYLCRTCGHSGWMTVLDELGRTLEADLTEIGRAALERRAELLYLHRDEAAAGEAQLPGLGDHVCVWCRRLGSGEACAKCGSNAVPVFAHRQVSGQTPPRDLQRCPSCHTDGSLGMLASRAASLASVAVGHLYTTPFNADRKLLAFSDSVQDASHRAGFFGGRTYRFSVRTALLAAVPEDGSIPLTELPERMWALWSDKLGDEDMVAAFMPRDLDYLAEYQSYVEAIREHRKSGRKTSPPKVPKRLRDKLMRRLQWEVTRELGLAARIGRTLERVGSATVQVDGERLEKAVDAVRHRLPNQVGAVRDVDPERWRIFVAGLLVRVRLRGGVFDELLRLYFQQDNPKHLSKRFGNELISPFGRFTSRPIFLTDRPEPKRFDTLHPRQTNWYTDWASRALDVPLSPRDARELYDAALPWLVEAGLFVQHRERKRTHWALRPEALRAVRDPAALRCDVCSHTVARIEGSADDLLDAPCLRFRCPGHLRARSAEETRERTYYRRFYERGELGRVWASEHTGLLERDDRESLEEDFQDRHRPDAPNLLSCTPTLEMGIDIGDLSATMLLSVPPSTSSYLQRIGRAGRKTGNALVLTFTTVTPHDLYFFDDPEAAMAGSVDPPGCYLDAPEILKRQALAWFLDAWAREAPTSEGLPPRVRDALRGDETRRFPAAFLRFVEPRRQALRESFLGVFGDSDSTRDQLERYLSGVGYAASPMEQALSGVFQRLAEERDDLRRLHRRVKSKLEQLDEAGMKVENADEEREELERERRFLERELAALQNRSLIGFLTERSVLPNYAFPETGVQLRAYVSRDATPPGSRGGGRRGGGPASAERYQWTRAASTAIRELAPFNTFYGMARKVRVDTVDAGSGKSGKSGENIVAWQLCGECGHMEPASALSSRDDCPRCGATGWREQGRRRELVRMERVAAFARQRDAAFSDESEDRERAFYVTETLFDPDPATARHAWLDGQTPFGFELLPDLTLREINFGRRYGVPGRQTLAGREVPDVEFLVCAECGQVHDPSSKPMARQLHRRWCTARDKDEDKQPFRSIHLYREVTTEALRMFVPVAMLDPQKRLPNVRAAIELGMKRFFGGDPDHLRVQLYDEPSRQERKSRRRYVVIHDTVPGGTGVLTELAANRGAKLKRVLELAKEALVACPCAATEAPACYRCLYAYRHQKELPVLDRELALELVDRLLGAFDALEQVPTIGVLDTATVTESELEDRFLDTLRQWARREDGASFEKLGEDRWSLRVGERSWTLQAQVTLDPGHDVAVPTRPDFVLWPADPETRAVAVYCDGFAYHVQPHEVRARLGDDFHKREAVRRSGRFVVCSLTWADLDVFDTGKGDIGAWLENASWRRTSNELASRLGHDVETKAALEAHPMDWLAVYLRQPEEQRWRSAATLSLFGALASRQTAGEDALTELTAKLRSSEKMPGLLVPAGNGERAYAVARLGGHGSAALLAHAPLAALRSLHDDPSAMSLTLRLDDIHARRAEESFAEAWRSFLRAHMALQWLNELTVVTTEQLASPPEVEYAELALATQPAVKAAETLEQGMLSPAALEQIRDADESVKELLEQALRAGLTIPDIPYEGGSGADGVDAVVELGWPKAKVAVFLPGEEEDATKLEAAGWRCFAADELTADTLIEAVRGAGEDS
jgi:DEAD/DEAH box helicase domain-containing protein